MNKILAAVAAVAAVCGASAASAGVIIQPKAVTVNIGGELLNFSAFNMIDQSGLATKYKSGVTDFDAYVAQGPIHAADSGEWLSTGPLSMARVTFDLGEMVEFNGAAIWNEDASSLTAIIGSLPIALGGGYGGIGLNDTAASGGSPYGPSVWRHQALTSRYVTFDIYGCNRAGFTHNGCGLGEVAFRSTALAPPPPGAVPEPATWAMMILGFGGVGATLRRRRQVFAGA